ncbi:TetR/AcrR family transcriptional regulator [Curtobacterium sp. Csp1]|uniref:TetR/AcrR family transcriptional regulator n=1 Tax=Curtobacterium citreum TaxID=2036 RepID=A0ABT2HEG1_9MICO|nr:MULTISPECIES: TetR/AcrR family transcriptional regulator [Curtobacterium]MCS6521635.1 TetR/AcrR family transcriptional regulator [Curtobacterium citreum]QKS13243.1 TetR/AcrR family transcriptional regulator [Curtobacterium sp. csp3]QKS19957.1 TetR/AcrR family transcriptional regulator [Curtobacterium sp. Csp1]GGL74516.1 TetR family transcriptional regulator [Curtobacterium citreum]
MTDAPRRPRHPRDRALTRRQILDAAEQLLAAHGTAVSIAAVAVKAGVSKSGLLHHFPSRDALLVAVADRGLRTLVTEVDQQIDPADASPGRGTRAYVSALCGGSAAAAAVFSPTSLLNALLDAPGTKALLQADAEYWRRFFADDGLPAARYLVIRHAAEGLAASSAVTPYLTADELNVARDALLDLTRSDPST